MFENLFVGISKRTSFWDIPKWNRSLTIQDRGSIYGSLYLQNNNFCTDFCHNFNIVDCKQLPFIFTRIHNFFLNFLRSIYRTRVVAKTIYKSCIQDFLLTYVLHICLLHFSSLSILCQCLYMVLFQVNVQQMNALFIFL